MKQSVLRELSTEELAERIEQEAQALENLKITHTVSQLQNPLVIREKRRTVARLKTELHKRNTSEQ